MSHTDLICVAIYLTGVVLVCVFEGIEYEQSGISWNASPSGAALLWPLIFPLLVFAIFAGLFWLVSFGPFELGRLIHRRFK
jgi:hypothetical protein